jgi:hypothetical protein
MSDSWINIIPREPRFVPSKEAHERALQYMQGVVGSADEVTSQLTEEVRFIDCGENLESIGCPHCKREIPTEWWQDQMEHQYENGYSLEPVRLHCCGALESLARLNYNWPQGYARFSVEAMNPDVPDLTNEQMAEFEKILGCPVIKVLQHI